MRKPRNSFEGCVDGKNKHVLQREMGKMRGAFRAAMKTRETKKEKTIPQGSI